MLTKQMITDYKYKLHYGLEPKIYTCESIKLKDYYTSFKRPTKCKNLWFDRHSNNPCVYSTAKDSYLPAKKGFVNVIDQVANLFKELHKAEAGDLIVNLRTPIISFVFVVNDTQIIKSVCRLKLDYEKALYLLAFSKQPQFDYEINRHITNSIVRDFITTEHFNEVQIPIIKSFDQIVHNTEQICNYYLTIEKCNDKITALILNEIGLEPEDKIQSVGISIDANKLHNYNLNHYMYTHKVRHIIDKMSNYKYGTTNFSEYGFSTHNELTQTDHLFWKKFYQILVEYDVVKAYKVGWFILKKDFKIFKIPRFNDLFFVKVNSIIGDINNCERSISDLITQNSYLFSNELIRE